MSVNVLNIRFVYEDEDLEKKEKIQSNLLCH